jgi:hypothetical protein
MPPAAMVDAAPMEAVCFLNEAVGVSCSVQRRKRSRSCTGSRNSDAQSKHSARECEGKLSTHLGLLH